MTRKKTAKDGAPARDRGFLAFVRSQPCDVEGCPFPCEAHHWGRHGVGTKCSDYETIPLCHLHHVEGWHRHGSLPGRTREEWLARWKTRSAALRAAYEAQGPRKLAPDRERADVAERWQADFLRAFPDVPELDADGRLPSAFSASAERWLLRFVWPHLDEPDEWQPVVTWQRDAVHLEAQRHDGAGLVGVEALLSAR